MEKLCTCLLSGVLVVNEVGVEGETREGRRGGGQSSVASLLIIAFLWKVELEPVTFSCR